MDYRKIDDDKFEETVPSTEQLSVAALKDIIANHQQQIDVHVARLQAAAICGVAAAQPAIDEIASQPLSPVLAKVPALVDVIVQAPLEDKPAS